MPTENETLLLAVLSQATIPKLNYVLLATQIDSPSPGAAAKKWQRFQKKLKDGITSTSTSPVVVGKKPVGVVKRSGKKVGDDRIGKGEKKDGGGGGKEVGGGELGSLGKVEDEENELQTPPPSTRRCPPRKSRVKTFKEESTTDEDECDEEEELEDGLVKTVEVESGKVEAGDGFCFGYEGNDGDEGDETEDEF